MYRKTVAVDLDGVLAQYHGFKGPQLIEPPMEGAREFLESLCAEGYKVVIYTSRETFIVFEWLRQWDMMEFVTDVNFCHINGRVGKPVAVAYVDDRAVPFQGDFEDALRRTARLAGPAVKKDTESK